MAAKNPVVPTALRESGRLQTAAFASVAAAAIGGDAADIDLLFKWVRPAMVRYCRARIGQSASNGEADDVAQEICLGLMAALPHYDDAMSRFVPFIYGI